jgi:hypothetical protein
MEWKTAIEGMIAVIVGAEVIQIFVCFVLFCFLLF